MGSMDDFVGLSVDFNIDFTRPESLAVEVSVSKDVCVHGDVWKLECYPRGAAGDDGAGEYLSFHLVNRRTARGGTVLFKAMVLGRGGAAVHHVFDRVLDYTNSTARLTLTRIIRTSELAERCTVYGYVTVACSVVLLRHNPIPVPQSTMLPDLRSLPVRNKYGTPDVTITIANGKSVGVHRRVLSVRSPVLKKLLDDAAAKLTANEATPDPEDSGKRPVTALDGEEEAVTGTTADRVDESPAKIAIDESHLGLQNTWTLYALLVYIYYERLPRDKECCQAAVTTELLRDLLAAADQYQIDRLKIMCARKLCEEVSVENVSKTLWYAHQHKCTELKNACISFISAPGNMLRVMKTHEFRWLLQESPNIMDEFKVE